MKMADKSEPKPKKPWFKKKRIIIPGVLLLIGIGASGGGEKSTKSASDDSSSTQVEASKSAQPESKANIGTQVRDGKFAFEISSVKCGVSKVGSGSFSAKAQGQYCVVTMGVGNIGKEPQTFFGSNQKAFDTLGREFSNDTSADLYDTDSQTWLTEINPGNSLTGKVYFDVPKDAKLDYIELHDSAFSGGVKVYVN
jgi:hypothetical protein